VAARLVALDLPGGPEFVDALRRVWDRGDAALPVDQRLPSPARHALLAALRPERVIGPDLREVSVDGGEPVEPGDALVMATSGTTGTPKGVVLTHAAVEASAAASSTRIGVEAGDRWLACLPMSHVGGLSVVTRALHTRTPLTVLPGFDAEVVGRTDATLVSLVATALRRIDPARFRTILLGGARPPTELPPNVVTTYGMTETGSGVVYDGAPLDGVELRITGGEIHVRGPMLFRGYRDGTAPIVDGWFATGDAGHLDGRGRLVVEGRIADLIVTGGENVWPEAVEAVLAAHPAVAEVMVAGRPDPEWGEEVVAYVVPAGEPPTLETLRDHVKAVLPAYNAPRALVVVGAIPRTALGKPVRRAFAAAPGDSVSFPTRGTL
jgi:O-succinylbenzoic acid--CoA ligase